MRCFLRLAGILFGLALAAASQAQLVAPPTLDWVSIPSTGTVNQSVSVGAGAHANLSDNSDGNEWNAISPGFYDYDPYVVAFITIELQRPGESSWTTLCQNVSPWQTPAENWGNFTMNTPGTHYIRVQVMDGRPWFSPQYTYAIGVPNPLPSITSQLNLSVNQGYNVSYTITATNSPTSFGASNLPTGLSVNTSTGVISGRVLPWTSTVNSTITATNAAGSDSQTLVWNITGGVITPGSSVSPDSIGLGSAVTLTRAGWANFGIAWTESTIWKPSGTSESLGNLQLGSQTYTPSAGIGTYSYQVRIVDNSGYNYVDQWISFTVTALPAPAGLQTTSVQSYSVNLGWNSVAGAAIYHVYRNGSYIGSTTGTSFNATGLSASTAYAFTVQAQDSGSNSSGQSTAVSATTVASFELFTPLP